MISANRWMWMTFAGWAIGIAVVILLSIIFDALGIEGWQFFLPIGMGLSVGFMQWLTLKKVIPVGLNWIVVTVLGLFIPFFISDLLSHFGNFSLNEYNIFIGVAFGGLLVGVMQIKILKKYSNIGQSWVLTSLLGWTMAVLAFWAINYTGKISDNNLLLFFLNLFLILVGGPVLGFITGKTISKIIPANKPNNQ